MELLTLVRRNYGGKLPVSIQCHNTHSFKEGVILLCQSILETRQISHLHDSALFTIPLSIKRRHKDVLVFIISMDFIGFCENIFLKIEGWIPLSLKNGPTLNCSPCFSYYRSKYFCAEKGNRFHCLLLTRQISHLLPRLIESSP